jgi:hypothetical protein
MIRYYPSFAVKTNLRTQGESYTLDGAPYSGPFYETYNGEAYTGSDPINGKNQLLKPLKLYNNSPFLRTQKLTNKVRDTFAENSFNLQNVLNNSEPQTYYPQPLESDYTKGYIIRYFIKKINSKGFVMEISPQEYTAFINGTVNYDVSYYQVVDILWKLTGPLNTVRISQYDIRAGIIDTNKRLIENANKNFLGLVEFIGGDYTKFSRPTS